MSKNDESTRNPRPFSGHELFEQVFRHTAIGMALIKPSGHWLRVNDSLRKLLGYTDDELPDLRVQDIVHPEDLEHTTEYIRGALGGGDSVCQHEKRLIARDGRIIWTMISTSLVRDESGYPLCFVAQVQDISELKRLEASVREYEERWKYALQGGNHGVWDWNVKTNEAFFSPEWKGIIGFEDHELANRFEEWRDRIHHEDVERTLADVRAYLDGHTHTYINEHRLLAKDGSYRWILTRGAVISKDEQGNPLRFVGTHTDITWRKHTEDSLRAQARFLSQQVIYDELTGLPGKLLLLDRIKQALAAHQRDGHVCAVAFLDIDGLKSVNDLLGYPAGDAVLRTTGMRLQQTLGSADTVARLTGDEFAVFLTNTKSRGEAKKRLRELDEQIRQPILWGGRDVVIRASMGVAFGPGDSKDAGTLLQLAEVALYAAKRSASDKILFFEPTLESADVARRALGLSS